MTKIEINIPIFERNMKLSNKKGLRRSYVSAYTHPTEYLSAAPLSASKDITLDVTIDKEFVEEFQNMLAAKGYKIVGAINTYHKEKLVEDFDNNVEAFRVHAGIVAEIRNLVAEAKENYKPYQELENEDCKFTFLPLNDTVESMYEFIKVEKDGILAYAKEKDITIMMTACAFTNQLEGFLGFNFFDADEKEEEVVVDYAARFTVAVDFNQPGSVYAAAVVLNGIGESKEELADPDLNVHLISENIKYQKA